MKIFYFWIKDQKLLNEPPSPRDQHGKNFWLHFWVQDQKLWNILPKTNIVKNFNFISEYRIKSCGIYPPTGYLVEILENLLFHVLEYTLLPRWVSDGNFGKSTFPCTVQWCMQICHKPFPHHMRAIWKC